MKKYLIILLRSIFSCDDTVDPNVLHVYLDIEEEQSLNDDPRRRKISKEAILRRFKEVYQKRTIKKRLFGWVIYKRIFIVEIRKIGLSDLKGFYLKNKEKATPRFSLNNDKSSFILQFDTVCNKPPLENPHLL